MEDPTADRTNPRGNSPTSPPIDFSARQGAIRATDEEFLMGSLKEPPYIPHEAVSANSPGALWLQRALLHVKTPQSTTGGCPLAFGPR